MATTGTGTAAGGDAGADTGAALGWTSACASFARVRLKERPINVVNPEVYAPGRTRRGK